jgi:hypothetical protein
MIDCFRIFGMPLTIVSDKGAPLVSRAVKEFCVATGIEHKIGVPENHQSDAIVESGARMVWPYLRLMAWELKKFHAWTPLLCNVQLSANALLRDSLGGASSSEIMFGRRVRPMRFLRPEALQRADERVPAEGPKMVNTFIADQAALQLRILGRAEAERHQRFQQNAAEFAASMRGFEHLDWVRVGMLISIPQPNHDRFNRPNKWALLRRGPYEVTAAEGTTLRIRDWKAVQEGRLVRTFQWPKRWAYPYHVINEEALERPEPPPAEDDDLPDMVMVGEPTAIGAVLSCQRLAEGDWEMRARAGLAMDVRMHVKNNRYLVRWEGRPHSDNSWEAYAAVWHTHAFQDFIAGSELLGHVAPSAYAARHRNHVNALVRGRAPAAADREVVIPHAEHVAAAMRGYFPLNADARRSESVRASARNSQEEGQALQALPSESEDPLQQYLVPEPWGTGDVASLRIWTDAGLDGGGFTFDRRQANDWVPVAHRADMGRGEQVQEEAHLVQYVDDLALDMPGLLSDTDDEQVLPFGVASLLRSRNSTPPRCPRPNEVD